MATYLHTSGELMSCDECHLKDDCKASGEMPFCLYMNKPEKKEDKEHGSR